MPRKVKVTVVGSTPETRRQNAREWAVIRKRLLSSNLTDWKADYVKLHGRQPSAFEQDIYEQLLKITAASAGAIDVIGKHLDDMANG